MDRAKTIIKSILKQYKEGLNRTIRKNTKEIGICVMIIYVACMVMYCQTITQAILCTVAFLFVKDFIKSVYYKINGISDTDGFPVRSKRFTKIDKYGFIEVNENDKMEIIQYLYEIENFIEKKQKVVDT